MSKNPLRAPKLAEFAVQSLSGLVAPQKGVKIADRLVERIVATCSWEDARKTGVSYWPDPLPTPNVSHVPDPLILFEESEKKEGQTQIALLPLTLQEVIARRNPMLQKLSMQVPLGLIDRPDLQRCDAFLVDLRNSTGTPATGGPLLILGTHGSGKGTILQIILLWLTARYLPTQVRCAVLDPLHDLEPFRHLPHLYDDDGLPLWSDGSTDKLLEQFLDRSMNLLNQSHLDNQQQETPSSLPHTLLILSNYQLFAERSHLFDRLKNLVFAATENQPANHYCVLTSTEICPPYLPTELLNRFGTRIALFLHEQQRLELFGKTHPNRFPDEVFC
jgi:hypothetical protein